MKNGFRSLYERIKSIRDQKIRAFSIQNSFKNYKAQVILRNFTSPSMILSRFIIHRILWGKASCNKFLEGYFNFEKMPQIGISKNGSYMEYTSILRLLPSYGMNRIGPFLWTCEHFLGEALVNKYSREQGIRSTALYNTVSSSNTET